MQRLSEPKTTSFDEFCQAVSERLKVDRTSLQPSALWVKDIGITSVDIVKISLLIRQKFGVKISTTQAGRVKTVQDAYELLSSGGSNA